MAIQLRRGTNAQWESLKGNIVVGELATTYDTERAFLGTGSGTYFEMANIDLIADEFSTSTTYAEGDVCIYQGKLYQFTSAHSGAWSGSDAEQVTASEVGGVTVDSALDDTSENPVQNKVITEAVEELKDNALIHRSQSGAIASFSDGSGLPLDSLTVDLEPIQAGSGDPSPTNVRPISGHSDVDVNVSGINVWDEQWESGDININDGSKRANTSRIRSKNFISVAPSTTYYSHNSYANAVVCFYDASQGWVSQNLHEGYETATDKTFTTPSWCHYIMFYMNGTTYNNDISINYPSTDTAYHPYNGNTTTVDLGQNVYGGELSITSDGTSVTSMMGLYTFSGSESWSYLASSGFWQCLMSGITTDKYGKTVGASITSNGIILKLVNNAYVRAYLSDNPSLSVDSDMNSIFSNGTQNCYELATPTTVTLTPTQVNTLLGQNNVWSDGDIDLTYTANASLTIQQILDSLGE